jgi:hypothetical protein
MMTNFAIPAAALFDSQTVATLGLGSILHPALGVMAAFAIAGVTWIVVRAAQESRRSRPCIEIGMTSRMPELQRAA